MICVSTVSYSVCLNSKLGPTFHPTRGLCQRDPLSPYLSLVCSGSIISHLLFTDDCILFAEANMHEVQRLRAILSEYEVNSGQCVNYGQNNKSSFLGLKEHMQKKVDGWGARFLLQ